MKRWATTTVLATIALAGLWNESNRIRAWSHRAAAERAFYDGNIEATMESYRRVRKILPREPYSYIDEADSIAISLDTGLVNDMTHEEVTHLVARGVTLYLEAIRLSPPGAWSYEGVGRLLESLARSSRLEASIDLTGFSESPIESLLPEERIQELALAHAVRIEPMNFYHRDHLGDFYLRHGFEERAALHFRAAARIHPILDDHFYVSDYIERIPLVRDAIALGIEDVLREGSIPGLDERVYRALSRVYLLQGRFADARNSYREAVKLSSLPHLLEIEIGQTLLAENDMDGALAAFQRSAALEPSYYRSWLQVGRTLDRLGRTEAAVEALGRARGLQPARFEPAFQLARTLDNGGRDEEAAQLLESLILNHSHRHASYQLLVDIYQEQQAWGNATRVARMLSDRFPQEAIFKQQVERLEAIREGKR